MAPGQLPEIYPKPFIRNSSLPKSKYKKKGAEMDFYHFRPLFLFIRYL